MRRPAKKTPMLLHILFQRLVRAMYQRFHCWPPPLFYHWSHLRKHAGNDCKRDLPYAILRLPCRPPLLPEILLLLFDWTNCSRRLPCLSDSGSLLLKGKSSPLEYSRDVPRFRGDSASAPRWALSLIELILFLRLQTTLLSLMSPRADIPSELLAHSRIDGSFRQLQVHTSFLRARVRHPSEGFL